MKSSILMIRNTVITLIAFTLFFYANINGQGKLNKTGDTAEINAPQKGTRIWSGSATISRHTTYRYRFNQDESVSLYSESRTNVDVQLRYLRFLNRSLSIGIDTFGQFYMENTFGQFVLGGGGLGPLIRYYPFMNTLNLRWQPYLQGGGLAGVNLALGDSVGAIRGEGVRVRSSLLGGITYRMSNALGIHLEGGHLWEGEGFSSPDARAWQISFGFQVFRF